MTSWDDTGLQPGTTYSYWVYAYRGSDTPAMKGWAPGYVSGSTYPVAGDPSAPRYESAASTEFSATITWSDPSGAGATIKRQNALGQFDPIGSVPPGTHSFTDPNRLPGQYYAYWVFSDSGPSAMTYITVITGKPNAPRPIAAAGQSPSSIAVTWLDQSPVESGFNVRHYDPPEPPGTEYWPIVYWGFSALTTMTHWGLDPGSTHSYWVTVRSYDYYVNGFAVETYAPAYIAASTFPP